MRRASLTDLLERHLDDVPVHGASVTVEMTPFQITTLKLEAGG